MKAFASTLLEQLVNAGVVAGIAALSMMAANQSVSGKVIAIAFGLTFLIELRKYRKMNG